MVFLVGLIYWSGTLPNHPFLYAFVLRPTQDEGFSFSAVCPAFTPPSLRSSHLWLLLSLRRESLSHKVANPDFQRSKAWRTAFPALCASFLCCYLGSLLHRPMQCLWTNRLFVRHQNDKYSYLPFLIRSTLSLVNELRYCWCSFL